MKRSAALQPGLFDGPAAPADLRVYDWIVISSSAGKDSMATLDYVCEQAEAAGVLPRVVVVHCDLGRVEWPGTRELCEQQVARYGVRFIPVWRKQGDLLTHIEKMGYFPRPSTRYCTSDHKRGQIFTAFTQLANETRQAEHTTPREGDLLEQVESRGKWPGPDTRFCTAHHKTNQISRVFTALTRQTNEDDLLQQVEERGMWPDARRRYCTSDQKRTPLHKVLTTLTTETNTAATDSAETTKRQPVRILSCMGMRAEESPARSKKAPFQRDEAASNGKRQVDAWLPLHRWSEAQVWERIRASRIADLVHPAYGLGMPRLSCCFCIFAPREALILAGKHNPELLAEYVRVEEKIGHKFRVNLSMADVAQAVAAGEAPKEIKTWAM